MGPLARLFKIVLVILLLVPAAHAYYKISSFPGVSYEAEARYHAPIILIPGIMGSVLVDQTGDELWPGGLQEDRSWLGLQEDGRTPVVEGAGIRATGPIRTAYGSDIYEGFYRYMDSNTPYIYRGYSVYQDETSTTKYAYLGRAYFDHGYDFRLTNEPQVEDVEDSLLKKVNDIRTKTKSDKVILVAHSMGGYQARLFADKYPEKVRAIIFMSTPHHGAPKAYEALTEGYNFGVKPVLVTNYQVWGFARNWPGAYELLPDEPFIKDGTWTLEESFYGDWVSYQATEHFKAEVWAEEKAQKTRLSPAEVEGLLGEIPRGLNSHQVARKMQEFRKRFNAISLDEKIRIEIINGDNQTTTHQFIPGFQKEALAYLAKDVISGKPFETAEIRPILRLTPIQEERGDKTVSLRGLQWEEAARTRTVSAEHGDVPNNGDAQLMMMEIVEDLNHDKRDDRIIQMINTTTSWRLIELRQRGQKEKEAEELARRIKTAQGKQEPGTLVDEGLLNRWRRDLEGRAKVIAFGEVGEDKVYRVNIVVPDAGQYDEKNRDFRAFVVIHDLVLKDSGIGTVKPSDATVTVKDVGTIESIAAGRLSLGQAYERGLVEVDAGLVGNILLKAADLVRKYLEK